MAPSRICSISGCCNSGEMKRGWCNMHYKRWYRLGNPLASSKSTTARACSIPGCEKPIEGRGWCKAHYLKWYKYGHPLAAGKRGGARSASGIKKEKERFIYEIVLVYDDEDSCLIWPFSLGSGGYPSLSIEGRKAVVSRFVCEKINGVAPTQKHEAAHSCGNGHLGCVNPNHLRWATHSENMIDMIEHGRSMRGGKHHFAKLTEEDVRKIRQLSHSLSLRKLAKMFGITSATVCAIKARRSWAWLS